MPRCPLRPTSRPRAAGLRLMQIARGLFVALCLGFVACAPSHAQNLASVRNSALPAVPSTVAVRAVAVVEGRAVALTATQAWVLDAAEAAWQASAWPADDQVLAVAGNGKQAVLLLAARPAASATAAPSAPTQAGRAVKLSVIGDRPTTTPLPDLPEPLTDARGALLANALFVAGHNPAGAAVLLRIEPEAASPAWQVLPAWSGPGRPGTLLAQTKALHLTLSGNGTEPDRLWRWTAEEGWTQKPAVPGQVLPGAGRATGQAHLLYLVRKPGQDTAAPALMTLHTITGSWASQGNPGVAPPAPSTGPTAVAVAAWKDGLLWTQAPSGQGAVLAAATEMHSTQFESRKLLLAWLDWVVIGIYLVGMLGIGLYYYLRERRDSTADFFVGGRSIPFWAAGVSLYATNTSSISYIAIPAKAFETNWQYLTNNLVAVVGLIFVATWVVPMLRRLDLMSVFSYLETRFHPSIRMLASALCIVMQIGSRMSVVLFLPALAIATITGLDVVWSVILMGGVTILYTALGGMKAVIWTDFVQVFVMFGGALFAIGFCIVQLNGGVTEFMQVAAAENKTKLFDFSFDLTKATVWGFIFLVVFDVVLTFPKDQVLMQRVLSTKSGKDAGRSIWAFGLIMIPGGFVFYAIGTALYAYYKAHPERMNPLLSIDATFPLFIAAELPAGVTGLIIAGIFAAAMSTLSSIINSVATLASVDFYERLVKKPTPRKSVLFAEVMTVAAGLVGIAAALVLSRFDIHSLFDVSIELAGLLGGGFAGAYTLGMFTRRANSPGVAIGIAASIVLTTLAWALDLVHPYFYLAISIMLCIVIGYIASLFFPAPARSLRGLTIYADTGADLEPVPPRGAA
jgi:SSS family solute:Na+ symporter